VLTATADVERISSLARHARADVLCARVAGRDLITCRIAYSRGFGAACGTPSAFELPRSAAFAGFRVSPPLPSLSPPC